MKYKFLFLALSICFNTLCFGQTQNSAKAYSDSIGQFIEKYIATHEIVKGEDKKHLHFYPADIRYRVIASFERIDDKIGFDMTTSQKTVQQFYRYGKLKFTLNDTSYQLTVFQSKNLMLLNDYKNYLFIPFTDLTNGETTYENGRYIDILINDINNNTVLIDFNKAYNPYCSYVSGYQCPIPPVENNLLVRISAGEMKYSKPAHR